MISHYCHIIILSQSCYNVIISWYHTLVILSYYHSLVIRHNIMISHSCHFIILSQSCYDIIISYNILISHSCHIFIRVHGVWTVWWFPTVVIIRLSQSPAGDWLVGLDRAWQYVSDLTELNIFIKIWWKETVSGSMFPNL